MSAQKALQWSKTETMELLGLTGRGSPGSCFVAYYLAFLIHSVWNKPGSTELSPKIKEHRAHALAAFSFIQCIFESNNTSAVGQIIV